jgi:hypothetical protein
MKLSQFDWLGQRSRPHYGQLTLWLTLAWALALAGYFALTFPAAQAVGPRLGPISFLSFLPDAILLNSVSMYVCAAVFVAAALCWVAQTFLPWSSWTAALSFTCLLAIRHENANHITHVGHMTNMMLLIYALWYHFYADEIRATLAAGMFWQTPLYPRWVYQLSLVYVCLFYGFSGWNKLLSSGPGWANGVSMQLWVNLWGSDSIWSRLILADRRAAQALQALTLLAEAGAPFALFFPRLRPVIGLALIGFHYGAIAVFGWAFHGNVIAVALVLLPVAGWIQRSVAELERRGWTGRRSVWCSDTRVGRLKRGLLHRFDMLGRFQVKTSDS